MPLAKVRGVNMNYKVLGNHGPWVALSPGGRRDISGIELLAGKVAETGHRVVVFDRRLRCFRGGHRWPGFGIRDLG